jgi:hypothetical protein
MNRARQVWPAAVWVSLSSLGTIRLMPDWASLGREIRAPHQWIAKVGADQAALTLALLACWLLAVWALFALSVVAASAVPGRVGACAGRTAQAVLPSSVRRAVAAAVGLSIAFSPVPVGAATPGPVAAGPVAASPVAASPEISAPGPVWPTDTAGAPVTPGPAAQVVVAPGDCLWVIAARRLGANPSAARIATEWPRWYQVNRDLIGSDPAVLRPGAVLIAPRTGRLADPSTTEPEGAK